MKICKLQGGLGNQMFQYAATRAAETNYRKKIYLDNLFLSLNKQSTDTYTARESELHIFHSLRATFLSLNIRKLIFSQNSICRLFRKLSGFRIYPVVQSGNTIVDIPSSGNLYLDGFFQSEKYFQNIRQDVIRDFSFPVLDSVNEQLISQISKDKNPVSIHVRRGDYVNLKNANEMHGVLPIEYYKKSVELLRSELKDNDQTFYIFSDDPEYIKEQFTFLENSCIVCHNSGKDSWKDMCLMKACKHHIIANSSFSWWGAWLCQYEGITIAPARWFSDKNTFDIHDFIPSGWQVVE